MFNFRIFYITEKYTCDCEISYACVKQICKALCILKSEAFPNRIPSVCVSVSKWFFFNWQLQPIKKERLFCPIHVVEKFYNMKHEKE